MDLKSKMTDYFACKKQLYDFTSIESAVKYVPMSSPPDKVTDSESWNHWRNRPKNRFMYKQCNILWERELRLLFSISVHRVLRLSIHVLLYG